MKLKSILSVGAVTFAVAVAFDAGAADNLKVAGNDWQRANKDVQVADVSWSRSAGNVEVADVVWSRSSGDVQVDNIISRPSAGRENRSSNDWGRSISGRELAGFDCALSTGTAGLADNSWG